MLSGIIRKTLLLVVILVVVALVKSIIDSAWRFLGFDPKGLTSLIALVIISFHQCL
ncbi:MAG: hypothetical protein FGF53_05845 [Candidatus Brockarchaeota archaeon]|nr:hypothetical protein [Candidatus Brockarchaeota archaeon]MBO3809060.1 hypothetical protein [Candidatus Brockarchaeota archaeon]